MREINWKTSENKVLGNCHDGQPASSETGHSPDWLSGPGPSRSWRISETCRAGNINYIQDISLYQTGKLNLRQYWCSGKLENSLLGRDNIIKRVDAEDDHEEKDPGSPDLLGDPGVPPASQDLGQCGPLSLVEECRGSSLIGRELS